VRIRIDVTTGLNGVGILSGHGPETQGIPPGSGIGTEEEGTNPKKKRKHENSLESGITQRTDAILSHYPEGQRTHQERES
jgi:hypothetical protein